MTVDARNTSELEKALARTIAGTLTGTFQLMKAVLKTVFNILTAAAR